MQDQKNLRSMQFLLKHIKFLISKETDNYFVRKFKWWLQAEVQY